MILKANKRLLQKIIFCAVFSISVLTLSPQITFAGGKARIIDASSRQVGENWLVNFVAADCFSNKVENAILSGITTTFTFRFTLKREVKGWADERLFSWKVRRSIYFDNLKQKFEVVMDNAGHKEVFTDFNEAKQAMITFKDLPVVVTGALSASNVYYVNIKVELDPVEMPRVLDKLFFFVPLWDFESPWFRIDLAKPETAINNEAE